MAPHVSEAEFVYDTRRRPSRRRFIVLPGEGMYVFGGGEEGNEAEEVAGEGAPRVASASEIRKIRKSAATLMLVLDLLGVLDRECPNLATSTGASV